MFELEVNMVAEGVAAGALRVAGRGNRYKLAFAARLGYVALGVPLKWNSTCIVKTLPGRADPAYCMTT